MGTIPQPVDVDTRTGCSQHEGIMPHAPQHQGKAAAAANNSNTNSGGSNSPAPPGGAAYWYGRAQRAVRQRAADSGQMSREYGHVTALDASIGHSCSAARGRGAAGRNRYANVLPYDHNRVVLAGGPYLNASHVSLQLPGLASPCAYIATQGPLPGTTADFWRMCAELAVPAVVMLTNTHEGGVAKCAQYFPPEQQQQRQQQRQSGEQQEEQGCRVGVPGFGTLQVSSVAPLCPDSTLRRLVLTPADGAAPHSLDHYHFHAWPDHGVPASSGGIRAMCAHLAGARASGRPVVVHCSAGIGRTGTFCAIDILLQRLDAWQHCRGGAGPQRCEVEEALDVPALVHALRRQRMGMVQTLEQYVFVYKALLDDLVIRVAGTGNSSSRGALPAGSSGGAAAQPPSS